MTRRWDRIQSDPSLLREMRRLGHAPDCVEEFLAALQPGTRASRRGRGSDGRQARAQRSAGDQEAIWERVFELPSDAAASRRADFDVTELPCRRCLI